MTGPRALGSAAGDDGLDEFLEAVRERAKHDEEFKQRITEGMQAKEESFWERLINEVLGTILPAVGRALVDFLRRLFS